MAFQNLRKKGRSERTAKEVRMEKEYRYKNIMALEYEILQQRILEEVDEITSIDLDFCKVMFGKASYTLGEHPEYDKVISKLNAMRRRLIELGTKEIDERDRYLFSGLKSDR